MQALLGMSRARACRICAAPSPPAAPVPATSAAPWKKLRPNQSESAESPSTFVCMEKREGAAPHEQRACPERAPRALRGEDHGTVRAVDAIVSVLIVLTVHESPPFQTTSATRQKSFDSDPAPPTVSVRVKVRTGVVAMSPQ